MTRKLIALIAATFTLFALLPAGMAFAAPSATSQITAGAVGFPGQRTMTIRVNNTTAGNALLGEKINYVRIHFPVAETGIKPVTDNAGVNGTWTGTVTKAGTTTQFITYTGGSINPGTNASFTFPVEVDRPLRSDRKGPFTVQVASGSNAATGAKAATDGALDGVVRMLEILDGSVKPIAPQEGNRGVADGTGTAGQNITYAFTVKNYAREAVNVTGTMTSSNPEDIVSNGSQTLSVAGMDGTATLNVPVQLGSAPNGDRVTTFRANAASSSSSGPGNAVEKASNFTIQKPVDVSFTDLDPTRVRPGVSKTFSLRLNKTGSQAFSLDTSSLLFGTNVATLDSEDREFAGGAQGRTYEYTTTDIIAGPNGPLDASATAIGQDDNLANYDLTRDVGQITLDDIIPDITVGVELPVDGDDHQQVATKDGDTIRVAGTITPGAGSDKNDIDLSTLSVVLQPNDGPPINVPVTTSTNGDEITYSGSRTVADWEQSNFSPNSFSAKATVADEAGNGAGATSASSIIDNVPLVLSTTLGDNRVISPERIRIKFEDATGMRGGCDPNLWSVAGGIATVDSVENADGTACDPDAHSFTDLVRVLVLANDLEPDETPRVTYQGPSLLTGVPAKDGASNNALRQTVDTVTDVLPVQPNIVLVERRTGDDSFEPAYEDTDESRYYTNRGGQDGIRVTVGGARQGYLVQVTDAAGNVLNEKPAENEGAGLISTTAEFDEDIFVPIGTTDGLFDRRIQFVSSAGNVGPAEGANLVLDTVAPVVANAALTGSDAAAGTQTVTGTFSEKIVEGTDYWADWFVSEVIQTEEGQGSYVSNAIEVTGSDMLTRTLTVELRDPSQFEDAYYLFTSNGVRYEDRAGNTINDSQLP